MKKLKEISKIACPVCGKSQVEEYEICRYASGKMTRCSCETAARRRCQSDVIEQARAAYARGEEVK